MADTPARTPRCPVCREPTVPEHRPFCSRRCADIDLTRWLKGSYVIAGGKADEDDLAEQKPAETEPPDRGIDKASDKAR